MRTFRTFDCRPHEFQQFLFANHAQLSRISNGDCLLCDIEKKWIYWVSFMSRLHLEALSECGWARQRKNIDESYEFYQTFYIMKLPRNWSQIWSSIHLYRYQGLTFGTELSFAGVIRLL